MCTVRARGGVRVRARGGVRVRAKGIPRPVLLRPIVEIEPIGNRVNA